MKKLLVRMIKLGFAMMFLSWMLCSHYAAATSCMKGMPPIKCIVNGKLGYKYCARGYITGCIPVKPPVKPLPVCIPLAESKLEIGLVPQHRDWWCWAACTEMVSSYYHTRVDQCYSADFVHGTPPECCTSCSGKCPCWGKDWGVNIVQIKNNWNHWLFRYEYKPSNLDWATLKATISSGKYCDKSPIYVVWNWYGGGGHVVMVNGYKDDKVANTQLVYYNNPWPPDCVKDSSGNCSPQTGGETAVSTYDDFVDDGIHKWTNSFYKFIDENPL